MTVTKQTSNAQGRRLRRGLIVGVGGLGAALIAASTALACTVGLHGGLLIVAEEPPVAGQPIDISVFSTDNGGISTAPREDRTYDVFIDPDAVQVSDVTETVATDPSECFGGDNTTPFDSNEDEGDDIDIGDIAYGTDVDTPPNAQDAYLYGQGSATIPSMSQGTYEVCTEFEPRTHWDHFRILDPENAG